MKYSEYAEECYQKIACLDHKAAKRKELSFAKQFFKPWKSDDEQLRLVEEFLCHGNMHLFSIATLWIKNNPALLSEEYIGFYEHCLFSYVDTWAKCDQYCYRVLNPLVESYASALSRVSYWAESSLSYVKRAAAVCLIHSSVDFTVNVDFEWIEKVAILLLQEEHLHVRKGLGWLLKYSYLAYPEETIYFIQEHYKKMSSVTFAYALEKMPEHTKASLRKL